MTFRTSPADRKDEEKSGEGAIVPKKRCPGQARDLSVFLRRLTFGAAGDAGIHLAIPCPMNCSVVELQKGLSDKQSQQP